MLDEQRTVREVEGLVTIEYTREWPTADLWMNDKRMVAGWVSGRQMMNRERMRGWIDSDGYSQ